MPHLFSRSAFASALLMAALSAPAQTSPAIEKEVKNLTADDFPEREAALKRLQGLVADQIKQRAAIQEVMSALQADLARQQAALAGVSDEEAQAQVAGLLEMERGLAGWTAQSMAEPIEKRHKLLEWGLTKENAAIVAQAYASNKRARIEGIKKLAKLDADGASWTLSRLINDRETAVRAAAMAAAWERHATQEIVDALWYRAVSGPLTHESTGMHPAIDIDVVGMPNMLKVDFPGGNEPLQFDDGDESAQFFDSQLAGDVLVHMNSPLVADKIKSLVADRIKAGKSLALNEDPDWTLVTHRLVEVYAVKDAIPLLADEALGTESEQMGGDMNGRPFAWSRRTVAIGTLAKLIGHDPADFELIRAHDSGDPRGWTWACEMDQQAMMQGNMSDGAPVRAFYTFWKDHHAEYGIKTEPSNAGVPPPPGRGRGRGGRPIPIDPVPGPNGRFPLNNGGPAVDVPAQPEVIKEPRPIRGAAE